MGHLRPARLARRHARTAAAHRHASPPVATRFASPNASNGRQQRPPANASPPPDHRVPLAITTRHGKSSSGWGTAMAVREGTRNHMLWASGCAEALVQHATTRHDDQHRQHLDQFSTTTQHCSVKRTACPASGAGKQWRGGSVQRSCMEHLTAPMAGPCHEPGGPRLSPRGRAPTACDEVLSPQVVLEAAPSSLPECARGGGHGDLASLRRGPPRSTPFPPTDADVVVVNPRGRSMSAVACRCVVRRRPAPLLHRHRLSRSSHVVAVLLRGRHLSYSPMLQMTRSHGTETASCLSILKVYSSQKEHGDKQDSTGGVCIPC